MPKSPDRKGKGKEVVQKELPDLPGSRIPMSQTSKRTPASSVSGRVPSSRPQLRVTDVGSQSSSGSSLPPSALPPLGVYLARRAANQFNAIADKASSKSESHKDEVENQALETLRVDLQKAKDDINRLKADNQELKHSVLELRDMVEALLGASSPEPKSYRPG